MPTPDHTKSLFMVSICPSEFADHMHQSGLKSIPSSTFQASMNAKQACPSSPHTLTDCRHLNFRNFPHPLFLFRAATNKSDFRQIPWILYLTLYRATLLYVLSVTKPGLFC